MPVANTPASAFTPSAGSSYARPTTSRSRSARPRTGRTVGTSAYAQEIICAVGESRGISPTVGLAFVNLTTSEAVLCQISDSQTYARTVHKLAVYDPLEILIAKTAADPTRSKLISIIGSNLPHVAVTDVEAIKHALESNYFATCCLAAALRYVEGEVGKRFAAHSLRIRYEPSEGSVMIDLNTIASLELIQNLQSAGSKDCLFGILNGTLTPMGARLLRSNILQPSTDGLKLETRYDAIEELTTRPDVLASVRQALRGFVDADRVLSSLTVVPTVVTLQHAESAINNVIVLKTYVSAIRPVCEALTGARSSLLSMIRDYRAVIDLIASTINDDVKYQTRPLDLRNQRIYAIKAGINSLLDVARQTYKEANNDAVELATQLSERHGMAIDLRFESGRQYFLRVVAADVELERLPDAFINVVKKRRFLEFQTLDLVKLNQKITDSHNEVISMSDSSIQELIDELRGLCPGLFRVSESIALLDMLAAFAHLAMKQDFVRPELTDTLAIKAGRHPILDKIHTHKYIPNDVYATQQSRFQIITGCNMSGKSTYIRSIALMTIMAQIGCFVPAQYASFPISHQVFARISSDDSTTANVSTFSAEMCEMAFILRNIRPHSMIIVDELGRGTSTMDGLTIAIAIAEALIDSHALVWFTTHFRELPRVLAERAGVVNLHLSVQMEPKQSKMTMLYKIADGFVEDKHYGLQLAKLLPFPSKMLEVAQHVSETLSARNEARQASAALHAARKQRRLLDLREKLVQASQANIEESELASWLRRLQDEWVTAEAAACEAASEVAETAPTPPSACP
ncbi:MutS protein msh4 [Ascosphaera acerosa]|nr:MutS protein msh4 [Ascosphaera acerosa]